MADRWDGCVVVAAASIDLDRLLRAFWVQVYEDHIGELDDSSDDGSPVSVAELLRREGVVPRGTFLLAAPFPGVGLLYLSPPLYGDGRSKDAPSQYALLARAVRQVLPDATSIAYVENQMTACAQVVLGDEAHDLDEPEDDHERVSALLAELDAQAGVEVTSHLTAVDLAPGRLELAWDEADPARLRAAEEALRISVGPAPRIPRLGPRLGERAPRAPTSPEDLPVRERGRAPTDLDAEFAAYASNQRLLLVLGAMVLAIAVLVAIFASMAAHWQPR